MTLLTKDDFQVLIDSNGNRYVTKSTSEMDKNHPGDTVETNETEGGRMYETGKAGCPVETFLKYLSKLHPSCNRLFQRPKTNFKTNDTQWFENKPLGANTLSSKMATISAAAGLSRRYTNHSLRATCITTLSRAGFEARMIRTVSGHKSDEAIDSYCRETTDRQKHSMSSAIAQRATASATSETPSTLISNTGLLDADTSFELVSDLLDGSSSTVSINREIRNTKSTDQNVWNLHAGNITINNHYH